MRISDWSSDVCSSDLILGGGVRKAGAVQDARGFVAHAHHRVADRACRFVLAILAAPVGGAADARHQRQRPFDDADDLAQRHEVGGLGQVIAAQFAAPADEQSGVAQVGEDKLERSEEHTSELQSLMRSSYAVFCLKKKKT